MRVCSFDIGYRHLAWCLFEVTDAWCEGIRPGKHIPPVLVVRWHMVDLLNGEAATCPVGECVDALVDYVLRDGSPLRETIELCDSGIYYMEQQNGTMNGNVKMQAFATALRAVLRLTHTQVHGTKSVVQVEAVTPARKALQQLEKMFGDWAPVRDHPPGHGRAPPRSTTAYTRSYYKAKSIVTAHELASTDGLSMPIEDAVIDKRDDLADALVVGVWRVVHAETTKTTVGRKRKKGIAEAMARVSALTTDVAAIVADACTTV